MRLFLSFLLLALTLFGKDLEVVIYSDPTLPQKAYILEFDPAEYEMLPARALDDGLGREKLASLLLRKGAIAAINGGFFETQEGTFSGLPAGILKINGKWFSLPRKMRGAIGWNRGDKEVLFDRLLTNCVVDIGDESFLVDGINKEYKSGEKVLYFPNYHRTTLTPYNCREIIQQGSETTIVEHGSNVIPQKGFVLTLDEKKWLKKGPLTWHIEVLPETNSIDSAKWQTVENIVGGTPLLIHKGQVIEDFSVERTRQDFLEKRHARTAFGIKKNGNYVFVVVDGKQEKSLGMTMRELVNFMKKLECEEALNLDGGSSSTMVLKGEVVNFPAHDGKIYEPAISDGILIFERSLRDITNF